MNPTTALQLRPACDCDLPELIALERECLPPDQRLPPTILEYIASQRSCSTFVAGAPGVVGSVTVHRLRGPMAEIISLHVLPDRRNSHVGTALMLKAEEWVESRGASTIYLEVDVSNSAGIALYHRLGYEVIEEFVEDGEPRFVMRKALGAASAP